MKKTQEISGLPVISITGGKNLGNVEKLIVNPENKNVDYLLLDREKWYQEMRVLNYSDVVGIGEFAITIQEENKVAPVSSSTQALDLLERDIQVFNTNVVTSKGKVIGTVNEFIINPETGSIAGYELVKTGEESVAGIIPADEILTLSREIIFVNDGIEQKLLNDLSEANQKTEQNEPDSNPAETEPKDAGESKEETVKVFEENQRQYLLGREVSKDIHDDDNNVIAKEGEQITEELIKRVFDAGKYIELTLNAK